MLEVILLRFSQNDKLWFHRLDRYLPGHLFRYFPEGLGLWRFRMTHDDWYAFIASFAHFYAIGIDPRNGTPYCSASIVSVRFPLRYRSK